jgi:hypothetical protein
MSPGVQRLEAVGAGRVYRLWRGELSLLSGGGQPSDVARAVAGFCAERSDLQLVKPKTACVALSASTSSKER